MPHRPTEKQPPPPVLGNLTPHLPACPRGALSQAEPPFKVKSNPRTCGVWTAATRAVRPYITHAHRLAVTVTARQPGPPYFYWL